MNIRDLVQRIKNTFTHHEDFPNEAVLKFLQVLENLQEEEASCDEVYAKIDQYVEREVDKKDAAKLMPLIRDHLDTCSDCCDEYEALLDVIENTDET